MPRGDGSISYDYPGMEQAYEEMRRINRKLEDDMETIHGETQIVLQASDGATRDGYEAKWAALRTEFADLKDFFGSKAATLDQLFSDMRQLDGSLGGGY